MEDETYARRALTLADSQKSQVTNMPTIEPEELEVVPYAIGKGNYQDVRTYDLIRHQGLANEYRQKVTSIAYQRLIGPLHEKAILDVGCGTGRGVIEFAKTAKLAVGSDASLDMLRCAADKATPSVKCSLVSAYAQQLPFASASFDIVTALNFLHLFSLTTQGSMIAEIKRVLKPGGFMVLEFDNALYGLGVGIWKRWSGREHGSMPWEIRQVIGSDCRVEIIYGAVFPIVWRLFCHFPRIFIPVEKIAFLPLLNRFPQRVYYKVRKTAD